MDKPGQGGSELHVQEKNGRTTSCNAQDFGNYLRKNSGVKEYWTIARGAGVLA